MKLFEIVLFEIILFHAINGRTNNNREFYVLGFIGK
jgi:hypothetical protein